MAKQTETYIRKESRAFVERHTRIWQYRLKHTDKQKPTYRFYEFHIYGQNRLTYMCKKKPTYTLKETHEYDKIDPNIQIKRNLPIGYTSFTYMAKID